MKTLSPEAQKEVLELGFKSAREMRRRITEATTPVETLLQSGWSGTFEELAREAKSSVAVVTVCVRNFETDHPEWDSQLVRE